MYDIGRNRAAAFFCKQNEIGKIMVNGMARKYYAVRQGHKIGVFTTWDECKRQVYGYSGAEYKSFSTQQEARDWIKGEHAAPKKRAVSAAERADKIPESSAEAVAYVDGSYNIHDGRFSYGVVLFHKGRMNTFSEAFSDPSLAEMRNVAGEIKGSEFAAAYCIEHHIKSIDIYYDYTGIEQWANGHWKTNKEGTRAYAEFIRSARQKVDIRFVKVKGHSGDAYNDMADRLAKDALGIL